MRQNIDQAFAASNIDEVIGASKQVSILVPKVFHQQGFQRIKNVLKERKNVVRADFNSLLDGMKEKLIVK